MSEPDLKRQKTTQETETSKPHGGQCFFYFPPRSSTELTPEEFNQYAFPDSDLDRKI